MRRTPCANWTATRAGWAPDLQPSPQLSPCVHSALRLVCPQTELRLCALLLQRVEISRSRGPRDRPRRCSALIRVHGLHLLAVIAWRGVQPRCLRPTPLHPCNPTLQRSMT